MPKSRVNKDRKEKVKDYKTIKQIEKQILKNNSMAETPQDNAPQGVPEQLKVRSVPKWKGNEILEITGIEFEGLYNGSIKQSAAFLDSVMNRNVVNGKIHVDFEKINEDGTDYEEMTEEEQAPFKKEFNQWLDSIRNHKPNQSETPKQDEVPSQAPTPAEDAPKEQAVVLDMKGDRLTPTE